MAGKKEGFLVTPLFFLFIYMIYRFPMFGKDLLKQTHAARGTRRNPKTKEYAFLRYLRSSVLNGFCIVLSPAARRSLDGF
jgi:hypothetical protein